MFTRSIHLQITLAIIAVVIAAASFAEQAGSSSAAMQMTAEGQKDMAGMYRKMADCLDSGSSSHDCMHTVMKDCPVMAKTGHCPLAEGMKATMSSAKPMGMKPDHAMKMGGSDGEMKMGK